MGAAQRSLYARVAGRPRRGHAEQQRTEDRTRDSHAKDRRIGLHRDRLFGLSVAEHMQNPRPCHPREPYADQSTGQGQHQALNEELTHQAQPACA